jgi:tetratricopeptide (TPR) repeat protein
VRARLDLGKAFSETGRYPDAATQLEAAVHLEPARAEAHYQLARVYQKLNEPARFHQELEVAKNLQSSKLRSDESVMTVTGARGDATQQLGLSPQRDTAPATNVSH